jgi:hypothetical protein
LREELLDGALALLLGELIDGGESESLSQFVAVNAHHGKVTWDSESKFPRCQNSSHSHEPDLKVAGLRGVLGTGVGDGAPGAVCLSWFWRVWVRRL